MTDQLNPNPARINQVTPATPETNARLAPNTSASQENFWTPGKGVTLAITILVAILAAVGPILAAGAFTPAAIVGAIASAIGTALAAFFGVKSGGTPKP